jgi:hypothetical protein
MRFQIHLHVRGVISRRLILSKDKGAAERSNGLVLRVCIDVSLHSWESSGSLQHSSLFYRHDNHWCIFNFYLFQMGQINFNGF